jgi:hypothetical protein
VTFERLRFRRWVVSVDRRATELAYRDMSGEGAEACACSMCRNFVAVRDSLYPAEVRMLFEDLGVDHRRETEVMHYCREPSGLHHYGGWLLAVGTIEEGRDAYVPIRPGGGFTLDPERIDRRLSLGFTSEVSLVPEAFARRAIFQIDISVKAPWVISLEEPD